MADLTDKQQVELDLVYFDDTGKQVSLADEPTDVPVWSNSNDAVGTLTVTADGKTAEFVTVDGASGVSTVSVVAGDGAGGSLTDALDITVTVAKGKIVSVKIQAQEPTSK
jgi:hypothetical protein